MAVPLFENQLAAAVPPSPPTGLTAVGGQGFITLTWNFVNGATSYGLRRSPAGMGTWTVLSTSITTQSYIDSPLPDSTSYDYQVETITSSGTSAWSATVTGTTLPPLSGSLLLLANGVDFLLLADGSSMLILAGP